MEALTSPLLAPSHVTVVAFEPIGLGCPVRAHDFALLAGAPIAGSAHDRIADHIALQDESAHRLSMRPCSFRCSRSPPTHRRAQHSCSRRSRSGSAARGMIHNHTMLTQQGWQLHVCNMLNGAGRPDLTSHVICVQLLADHVV